MAAPRRPASAIYTVEAAGQPRWVYWDGELVGAEVEALSGVPTAHGPASGLRVRAHTGTALDDAPLTVTLTFLLPTAHPFLLWQVVAHNAGLSECAGGHSGRRALGRASSPAPAGQTCCTAPVRFSAARRWEDPHPRGPAGALRLVPPGAEAQLAFFSNGYQSWSFAGALQAGDYQPGLIFGPLGEPKALNLLTPQFRRRGRFSSDMFGVRPTAPMGAAWWRVSPASASSSRPWRCCSTPPRPRCG